MELFSAWLLKNYLEVVSAGYLDPTAASMDLYIFAENGLTTEKYTC